MLTRYLSINEYDQNIRKIELEKIDFLLDQLGFSKKSSVKSKSLIENYSIFENDNGGVVIARIASGCYPYRDKEFKANTTTPFDPTTFEFRKEVKMPEYNPSELGYDCCFQFLSVNEQQMNAYDFTARVILPHWHIHAK